MSRWREQQIGFDEEQVEVLAQCLVKEKILAVGIYMVFAFIYGCAGVKEFANLCEMNVIEKRSKADNS